MLPPPPRGRQLSQSIQICSFDGGDTRAFNRFSRSGISTFRHWSQGLANKTWSPKCHNLRSGSIFVACENIRFSSLFAAGDVSRGPSGEERGETDVFAGYYFRFALKITLRRAWRNEKRAWCKPSTKRLPPTFLTDWHLPNQPTKITSVACFSSMQIFHAWEKCRLADLKNSFYLLIFSAKKTKNKTVSTITFNFLRD